MTAFDLSDAAEPRIRAALEDLAAGPRPEYFEEILEETARMRQRPTWSFPGQWLPRPATDRYGNVTPASMRLLLLLVVLGVALATVSIVGALLRQPTRPDPRFAPISLGSDGWLDHATTWAADAHALPTVSLPAGRLHLVIGYGGATAALRLDDDSLLLASKLSAGSSPGVIDLSLYVDRFGCHKGDQGVYAAALSEDAIHLRLSATSDACDARRTAFERTWTRTFDATSRGGTAVIDVLTPAILVKVPEDDWGSISYPDSFSMSSQTRTLTVLQDPVGLVTPCDPGNSSFVPMGSDLTSFEGYLKTLSYLTVTSSDADIAGLPARRVRIQALASAPCPKPTDGRSLWRSGAPPGVHTLGGGQQPLIEVTVVRIRGVTLLFEVDDGDHAPAPDAAQILDTVRFPDGLDSLVATP